MDLETELEGRRMMYILEDGESTAHVGSIGK